MVNDEVLKEILSKTNKKVLNTNIYKHKDKYYVIIRNRDDTNTVIGGFDERYTAQKILNKPPGDENKLPKYVSKTPTGRYLVRRTLNGVTLSAGAYKTLNEAKDILEKLYTNKWDINSIMDDKYNTPTYKNEFIQKKNNQYHLIKKTVTYGLFDDVSDAREFRNRLVKCDWNIDMKHIRRNNDKYEVLKDRKSYGLFNTLSDAQEYRNTLLGDG